MRKKIIFLTGCAALFLAACGYTTKSLLPPELRSIAVEPIQNEIDYSAHQRRALYVPLIEVAIRSEIVNRFQIDGNLRITEPETASLILRGSLVSYDRGELRVDPNNDVQEYRIYVSVNFELWDTAKQEARWSEPRFTGEGTYFVSGPRATSEQVAIDEAIKDLARRIVERTTEDW
jgi:outer membrane lipopolysaccharide assembly protein LptE/RlpB